MKKKNDFIPPKEIVVNGEIVKMHSSREERLRMAPISSPKKMRLFLLRKIVPSLF